MYEPKENKYGVLSDDPNETVEEAMKRVDLKNGFPSMQCQRLPRDMPVVVPKKDQQPTAEE